MAQTNKRAADAVVATNERCLHERCFRKQETFHPWATKVGNSPMPAIVGRVPRGVQSRITLRSAAGASNASAGPLHCEVRRDFSKHTTVSPGVCRDPKSIS